MTTALDIIQDAFEILRVYAPGEQLSPPDAARGLLVFNDMLDVWSNESLTCYTWTQNSFTLVPGISNYSIGPGGAIPATRPLRVSEDPGSAFLTDANNNTYPMDVVDQMTWNLRTTAAVNSNLPDTLLYNPTFPLGVIQIWPQPNEGYLCTFSSYLQLADLSSLSATFSLPPGYKRAITLNLSLSLKPYFVEAQIDPMVVEEARTTKGTIKRNNMRAQRSVFDPELVARGSSTYNIRSDRNY
jgi:hypothetical protein